MANPNTAQANAVGEVTATTGEVFAKNPDGQVRRLAVGDKIFEGEVIITANGSSVEINMFNGPALNLAEQQSVVIDSQVASSAQDATAGAISELGSTEAAKVTQILNRGDQQDFNLLLEQEAAAAGLTDGDGGGNSFVDLVRNVESVPVTDFDFPINPTGTAPTIEGESGVPAVVAVDGLPSITVSVFGLADPLVVDETLLGTIATSDFSDNFSSISSFGADGAGTITSVYAMGFNSGSTGLVDTTSGLAVVLSLNGSGVVEGRAGTGGALVFTVSVNSAGLVTLDQVRAIVHPTTNNHDEGISLATDNLITLTRTDTITDADGDTASSSATVNIGTAISFKDDGPTAVTLTANAVDVVHDETPGLQQAAAGTSDADGDDVLGTAFISGSSGPTVASLFASLTGTGDDPDVTANPIGYARSVSSMVTVTGGSGGADGEASRVYTLSVSSSTGAASGVSTTEGTQIFLYQSGSLIVGRVGTEAGETDTADSSGTIAFAISIDASTGEVFTVQYLSLRHPTFSSNYDEPVSLTDGALLVTVTLTDGDGDTAASTAQGIGSRITFEDDGPSKFVADPGAVLDTAGASISFALNLALGADGPGTAVFDFGNNGATLNNGIMATDIAGNLLKLNGQQIYLFGDNTGTLTGTTSSTNHISGTIAFTLTLNPGTNTYAVELNGTISNGTELIQVSNLTSTAGTTSVAAIGADNPNNNVANIDFLLIGRSADGTTGSVNTSATTIGVDNQSMSASEALRIDFVSNATANSTQASGFAYAGHVTATSFRQDIPTVQGPGDGAVTIIVTAILADYDQDFQTVGIEAGETKVNITSVRVFNALGTDVTTLFLDGDPANGEIVITLGVATISGLRAGYDYQITTASPFSAVLTESAASNTEFFDLGLFTIDTQTAATPINLAYNVVGTDADGDSATGTLSVALLPNNTDSTIGDSTSQTLTGDADSNSLAGLGGSDTLYGLDGADFLYGGAGDDILVGGNNNDVLFGQTGSDTLTGGAASDRFVFQRGDLGLGVDTITDFTVATPAMGGDVLDISDLLTGAGISAVTFAGAVANYLVVTSETSSTTISFDADGSGSGLSVQIATLQGINVSLATLLNNNQIDYTV